MFAGVNDTRSVLVKIQIIFHLCILLIVSFCTICHSVEKIYGPCYGWEQKVKQLICVKMAWVKVYCPTYIVLYANLPYEGTRQYDSWHKTIFVVA